MEFFLFLCAFAFNGSVFMLAVAVLVLSLIEAVKEIDTTVADDELWELAVAEVEEVCNGRS